MSATEWFEAIVLIVCFFVAALASGTEMSRPVQISLYVDQPTSGVMETDWAENRVNAPQDFLQRTIGKVADVFGGTYKRDKFRTRIERGVEPGTVEIFISARAMEQATVRTLATGGVC